MALILKKIDRPRELKWYQAGGLLYGDWGTSKAYVLGIAFALAGHASWLFLGLMSVLTALVGVCYMIICRIYPDGGGVYSSVKSRSQTLAVLGGFLLFADYTITASLSSLAAFHYFNVPSPHLWAIGAIVVIGLLNWIGPSKGSQLAVLIGIAASISTAILFLSTLPHLPHVDLRWPTASMTENWSVFVGIVLALSGVEAIANMTGIMVEPVHKTARKAIIPVLLEVSVVTFLLGIAVNAIPNLTGHTEDMLRALGNFYIGDWYGQFISVIFGLLLLSATNTALGGLVSIQFAMAKDRELPAPFSRLNRFGMPGVPLLVAISVPALVLLFEHDLVALAAFYAIGVVGAITLNLGSTATNFNLKIKRSDRILLFFAASILLLIEITIATQKHSALLFAVTIVGSGLVLRTIAKAIAPPPVSELLANINVLTVSEAVEIAPLYRSSSLVALRQPNDFLLEEAVLHAKAKNENALYLIYVEEIPDARELSTELEPSREALELLARAQRDIEKLGLTAVPIWRLAENPGKAIAGAARDLEVRTVLIGTTRRAVMVRLFRGDVLRTLSKELPKNCHLVISG